MRQDRSNASVQLAARQFIEFYGLSPESVIVDTCLTTNFSDADLCTEDQSKLVRVRAFFKQPTVFMRLLGVQSFDMWVSATSQTAALDVVIVMDVAETMAAETTYADWTKTERLSDIPGAAPVKTTNYGVIYRAPHINEIVGALYKTETNGSILSGYVTDLYQNGTAGVPALLKTPQINVNSLLTYYPYTPNVTPPVFPGTNNSGLDSDGSSTSDPKGTLGQYNVTNNSKYEGKPEFRVEYNNTYFGTTAKQPRSECRVRFYPPAINAEPSAYRGTKNADGSWKSYGSFLVDAGMAAQPQFDGFVPTYNYYGCCNDPDGMDARDAGDAGTYQPNASFEDLVCQPFKQVREATFGFLDRIDFLRGDRAAFVTYDRTAFLVNPFPYLTGAVGDETKRPGAMLDSKQAAYLTLKNLIGVRAEPFFYLMAQPGVSSNPAGSLLTSWPGQSAGATTDGVPIAVNYAITGYDPTDISIPASINYPVYGNCDVRNAMASPSDRSLFPNGMANASLPSELSRGSNDARGYDVGWLNHANDTGNYPGSGSEAIISGTGVNRVYNVVDMAYDYRAACRTKNIGAALREANNALLNPSTSRRFGTIWIVVLMSDGGAGASDPVRRNGAVPKPSKPYQANKEDPTKPALVTSYGARGEYGFFGLCPIGTPSNPGELITYDNDTLKQYVTTAGTAANNPTYPQAKPPYCADEIPESRHTCDFRPLLTLAGHPSRNNFVSAGINPLQDNDYVKAGGDPTLPAGSTDAQVFAWNKLRNHLYDVDIGDKANTGVKNDLPRGGCDPLYDVEDYARDWADYIAIANLGTVTTSTAQVPTLFTIGFAIEFTVKREAVNGAITNYVSDVSKTVNDPANATLAQTNFKALCRLNVQNCLGEQLLRYIADIGDNNRIDNDYYQDLMYEWYKFKAPVKPGDDLTSYLDGLVGADGLTTFGSRDACQTQNVGPVNNTYNKDGSVAPAAVMSASEIAEEWGQLRANLSCGNYYYSPNADQLQFVFDDIASRMFTRLSR